MEQHRQKVNASSPAGKLVACGVLVGGVIPLIVWVATGLVAWPLVIVGAAIVLVAGVQVASGKLRSSGRGSRSVRSLADAVPYDPATQYPVVRASICTGERVAGFKNRTNGHFTEVMLITSAEDEQAFMDAYQIETLKTEY